MTNVTSETIVVDSGNIGFISDWMSHVRGAEYGFFKAVVYALEQFQNKNNLPLTAMVAICNGKTFKNYKIVEGDRLAFATPLKRILAKSLSNATLTFKDGKAKWKVGPNGGVNTEYLEALRILAAQGASIRSQGFKETFPAPEKKAKPVDVNKSAEHVVKYLTNLEGVQPGEVLALVQSMLAAKVTGEPNF